MQKVCLLPEKLPPVSLLYVTEELRKNLVVMALKSLYSDQVEPALGDGELVLIYQIRSGQLWVVESLCIRAGRVSSG